MWSIEKSSQLIINLIDLSLHALIHLIHVWMSFQDCIVAELMKKIDDQGEMMKKFEKTLTQFMKDHGGSD